MPKLRRLDKKKGNHGFSKYPNNCVQRISLELLWVRFNSFQFIGIVVLKIAFSLVPPLMQDALWETAVGFYQIATVCEPINIC